MPDKGCSLKGPAGKYIPIIGLINRFSVAKYGIVGSNANPTEHKVMTSTLPRLDDMDLFRSIVSARGLTAAARHRGIPRSTVSRRLQALEDTLGVRLLERTTRNLKLTDAGAEFLRECEVILDRIETVRRSLSTAQQTPEGRLTLYAPSDIFRSKMRELTVQFANLYPNLSLSWISGAARPHLIKDDIDVMIHIDDPQDSSFVARAITTAASNYYASPDYLARCGEPQAPEELRDHTCIAELTHERSPRPWFFPEKGRLIRLSIDARYTCDTVKMCQFLAEEGLGITMIPDFTCRQSVAEGRLVKLFQGIYEVDHNVYAMYRSRRLQPARIAIFLDFLSENMPDYL